MKLTDDILAALRAAETDGSRLVLAGPRMDPKLYKRVDEVLEAVGGRWTKTAQAHVFPVDAAQAIAPVLATGQVVTLREKRQDSQYFPTPPAVVQRLVELAEIKPGMEVLEPSAGSGAIASVAAFHGAVVDCIERDPGYAAELGEKTAPRDVRVADFLTVPASPRYDRVVMNPPFTRQADVAHVQHALRFLKPDGLLAAVMSHAVTYQRGAAAKFRHLVEQRGGTVEALPEGTFAKSGTGVRTILVTVPAKRRAGAAPVVWPGMEQAAPASPEPEELGDPVDILRELKANLQEALSIFDELERDLLTPPAGPAANSVDLPQQKAGQLTFDDEAAA